MIYFFCDSKHFNIINLNLYVKFYGEYVKINKCIRLKIALILARFLRLLSGGRFFFYGYDYSNMYLLKGLKKKIAIHYNNKE